MYPDTADGVRDMLNDDGTPLRPVSLTPDPEVRGCWRVGCDGDVILLAYIGNHPCAPDFEEVFE